MPSFPILDGLPERERADLLGIAHRRRFSRGEVVFCAGAEADSLHLVDTGCFWVRREGPGGRSMLLAVVGPRGFFGELALLGPSRRTATVVAAEAATTLAVSRAAFDELRARQPAIDRALAVFLGAQVGELSAKLLDAMYTPVETRVCCSLLEVCQRWGRKRLPLTQQDVAELAGTTRPTANRILHQLAGDGLIDLGRSWVVVTDPEGLERRSRSR